MHPAKEEHGHALYMVLVIGVLLFAVITLIVQLLLIEREALHLEEEQLYARVLAENGLTVFRSNHLHAWENMKACSSLSVEDIFLENGYVYVTRITERDVDDESRCHLQFQSQLAHSDARHTIQVGFDKQSGNVVYWREM